MKKIIMTLTVLICTLELFGQKNEIIYYNTKDSTLDNCMIIYPKKTPYKSFLILIHEYQGQGYWIPYQSDIPKVAAENGILVIMPTLKTGSLSFGIDSLTQASLDELITKVQNKFKLSDAKFYIGGFSIGGSCAAKYAERAHVNSILRKPNAVFLVDPLLDFERCYNSMKRNIRLTPDSIQSNKFAISFMKRIEQEMGGTPTGVLQNYYTFSPYSLNDTTQQAVKQLRTTPIRLITEPDIEWRVKEWNQDYYSTNSVDCAALINELQIMGNKDAILVTTTRKGYRKPNHRRNPHSWSIADPKKTIKWLLQY